MTITVKLADALLRRKELQEKVKQIHAIKENQLVYQIRSQRIKSHEGLDDLNADYPKLTLSEVTAEYDFYARQLRLIDAAIQQTNWTADVSLIDSVMTDYVQPK